MTSESMQSPIDVEAADEIIRVRAENTTLVKAVGEEGRANRMTTLYESQRAVLDAIDALHQPDRDDPVIAWCVECLYMWPCNTRLLIHPISFTKPHQQKIFEMIPHTPKPQESSDVCDVIACNEKIVECHSGEIYFCQQHYAGAVAAQTAGIPVEMAYIYKS